MNSSLSLQFSFIKVTLEQFDLVCFPSFSQLTDEYDCNYNSGFFVDFKTLTGFYKGAITYLSNLKLQVFVCCRVADILYR